MALDALVWPAERLADAREALVGRARMAPADLSDAVPIVGHRAEAQLRDIAPAIIDVVGFGLLAVLAVRAGRATLVQPIGTLSSIDISILVRTLVERRLGGALVDAETLIDDCDISADRRSYARDALLREWSADDVLATAWPLRDDPGTSLTLELRRSGAMRHLTVAVAAHAGEYLAWLTAWAVLGRAALSGRVDNGWLAAWVLLLTTLVAFRWTSLRARGAFATALGGLLKQRLFAGALRVDPEWTRRDGVGGLLARVIESDTVETLALDGGLASALAIVELGVAVLVLAFGADGAMEVVLLLCWTAFACGLAVSYSRKRTVWTEHRRRLTHQLVENMTGHRTRIAQQPPDDWHVDEDAALAEYMEHSSALDRDGARLASIVARGWPLIGLAGLAPVFLAQHLTLVPFAIGVGGVLLAQRALERLMSGATQLAGAWIAWRQVSSLFAAAASQPERGVARAGTRASQASVVLSARAVSFQYAGRSESAVRDVSLEIRAGDRVLLEGDSGSGKSSLVGLLAGWRKPASGSILANGYDRHILGTDGWRSRVVAAPQYHENHLVSAPLAFNLLMGRRWPASTPDLAEAERVCRGLGLGPLLERMPAGLQQIVGESGWQLSQGERGRVFIARALLQGSDVVILDESFAALDPESTQTALEFCKRYAKTLIVVAHP